MEQNLPKDPVMLLSYINTQLRDYYPSLTEFCRSFHISEEEIRKKLAGIQYEYNEEKNQFI